MSNRDNLQHLDFFLLCPPPSSLVGAYLHTPTHVPYFFYIMVYYVMARALKLGGGGAQAEKIPTPLPPLLLSLKTCQENKVSKLIT